MTEVYPLPVKYRTHLIDGEYIICKENADPAQGGQVAAAVDDKYAILITKLLNGDTHD